MFLRLADCNLECTWCDTAYTWAFTEQKAAKTQSGIQYDRDANSHSMENQEILDRLEALWLIKTLPTIIVVSGGEPLMQGAHLASLAMLLDEMDNDVHIETAATITPPPVLDRYVTQYNVSPKLAHSGNPLAKRRKLEPLRFFAASEKSWFKFVVTCIKDLDEVQEIAELVGIDRRRLMIMPEGVTAEDNLTTARLTVDEATRRGWGISFRTHILLWKDVRGR
jgi:7-carboxy-7-deazaguanine synthase